MSHRLDNYRWDDAMRIMANEIEELKAKVAKLEAEAKDSEPKFYANSAEDMLNHLGL